MNLLKIESSKFLIDFKKEFEVNQIYPESSSGSKRILTLKEKEKIQKSFFENYFLDFFENKRTTSGFILSKKIKLFNINKNIGLGLTNFDKNKPENQINISFEKIDSNIIFNLIKNYEVFYDIGLLENF